MKRVIAILAFAALVSASSIASFCVQPKGQLLGKIKQMEANGYTLASINCAQVSYFVAPTPPYLNATITVRMNRVVCPDGGSGPCYYFGSAVFTADEVVVNNNGNTIHTNVTEAIVAL